MISVKLKADEQARPIVTKDDKKTAKGQSASDRGATIQLREFDAQVDRTDNQVGNQREALKATKAQEHGVLGDLFMDSRPN